MIVFYKTLFAAAFSVCWLWLASLTVISSDIAIKSFKGFGGGIVAFWMDVFLCSTPFLCIAFAVHAVVGKFRPLLLSIALVIFAICGIWLGTMQQ